VVQSLNPFDTVSGGKTCKGNPVKIQMALPYLASQIQTINWDATNNSNISPNGLFNVNNPVPVRTYVENEITYNVYELPQMLTFNASGVYRITATVIGTFTSECGNSQIVPIDMVVLPNDKAAFNFSTAAGCNSAAVNFTDATVPENGVTITQWLWNFGDLTTFNGQNPPTHNYAATGIYNASIRVINDLGCFSDSVRVVDLTGGLTANFNVTPGITICTGNTITFSDLSTNTGPYGPYTNWHWNFGEGTPVNATTNTNQTHTYNTPGIYTATLQAETANGCLSNIYDTTITVSATPVASFIPPIHNCSRDSIQFNSTSTISVGTINEWHWNFGDPTSGASNTSTLQNPKHKFTAPGTYTVSLYVVALGGCTSPTISFPIVINQEPDAAFGFTTPTCAGSPVTFSNLSVPHSGNIIQWNWVFGDGGIEQHLNGTSFTHTYANGGPYTATLQVTTDSGCTSTVSSQNLNIRATPVANFTLPGNLCLPNASATFINTSTINDGSIATVTYSWDFGDGSLPSSNATHIYTGVGPYTVVLTATSAQGCVHDTSKIVNTLYAQPVAMISAPTQACIKDSIQFTDNSTAANSTLTSWSWDFGDGGTSTLQNPKHRWNTAGPFVVTLQVTSAAGCNSTTATHNITINALPVANFDFSTVRCIGETVTFNDLSTPNATGITQWNWSFGDGNTLVQNTASVVTHTYTATGNNNAYLIVTNTNGCISDTTFIPVSINPKPFTAFSFSNICIPPGTANFTSNSTISAGSIAQWSWDFGDLSSLGNTASPSHTYTNGGAYMVTLTTTSALGCTKDSTMQIKVFNVPDASYTINNVGNICSNTKLEITNTSIVNGYGAVDSIKVFWDFGTSNTNVTADINPLANEVYAHNYPIFGTPATQTYSVLIKVYNGPGCEAQFQQPVTIFAAPKVRFNPIPSVCQEIPVVTLSSASDMFSNTGIGTYSGAGISASPLLVPADAGVGTHPILYTFVATNGCRDSAENNITVFPTPNIYLGPDRNILEGDFETLTPVIAIGSGLNYTWTPSTYLDNSTSSAPICTPLNDITYNLEVVTTDGCKAEDELSIKVVKDFVVPNTFTPNGDGINDKWVIENLNLYPNHIIQVFNRYGQIVFESKNYLKPWDGTYKGKPLSSGTYYYIIDLDGKRVTKKGYITIIK
jgi:gliding motility-associated-like protein